MHKKKGKKKKKSQEQILKFTKRKSSYKHNKAKENEDGDWGGLFAYIRDTRTYTVCNVKCLILISKSFSHCEMKICSS